MLQNISPVELWAGLDPKPYPENPYLTEIVDRDSLPGTALIGRTAFHRHYYDDMAYLEMARKHKATPENPLHIAFLGGSIGAQGYSVVAQAHAQDMHGCVRVTTMDLSPRFTSIARAGIYPASMINRESGFNFDFLEPIDDHYVRIKDDFKKCVDVLPAGGIEAFSNSNVECDVVALSNVLIYVNPDVQHQAIKMAARHARHAVSVLWGHLHEMPRDLYKAGLKTGPRGVEFDELLETFQQGKSFIAYKM